MKYLNEILNEMIGSNILVCLPSVLQPVKAWQVHSGFRWTEEQSRNQGDA